MHPAQKLRHGVCLQQRLPAGACHAAGCRAEDLLVTQHQLCQLLAGDPAPRHINGTGETGLCAAAAAHAACRIPHRTLRPHRPRTGRAAVHAGSAPDAALRAKDQLRLRILCLRVVAPGTAEIAALQKHGGPHAGSIMERHALDIRNEQLLHGAASVSSPRRSRGSY